MDKIIAKLAEANDLKGVIDVAEWNDDTKLGKGQEMVDRSPTWSASSRTRPSIFVATAPRATTCWAMPTNT
jgi:hypothetical protein